MHIRSAVFQMNFEMQLKTGLVSHLELARVLWTEKVN